MRSKNMQLNKIHHYWPTVIAVIASIPLSAQTEEVNADAVTPQSPYVLEPYTSSATTTETSLFETGAAVSAISADDIARSHQSSLIELIKQVPGVHINQATGINGQAARLSLRGTQARHTAFIVDGVRLNNTNSADGAAAHNISLANIESIEILRGPQSVLYGSNAIGGVISITTKKATKQLGGSLDLMAGAYDTKSANISIYGSEQSFDYAFAAESLDQESEAARNDPADDIYRRLAFRGNIGRQLSEHLDFDAYFSAMETNIDADSSAQVGDASNEQKEHSISTIFTFSSDPKIHNSTLNLTHAQFASEGSSGSSDTERNAIDWRNHIRLNEKHSLFSGAEYSNDQGEQAAWWLSESGFIFESQAIYAQYRYESDQALFSDLGIRYVDTDDFGDKLVWKSSISYLIPGTKTRLKANYGTAYNAPNVYYFLNRADDNLAPEQSRGFDLGFEQTSLDQRLWYGIAYFQNDIRDQFDWNNSFKVVNVNETRSKGIESFLRYQATDSLAFNVNYTWLDAKDQTTGKTLNFSPQHTAHAAVSYLALDNRLDTLLSVDYVGGQFNAEGEATPSGGYVVCNLASTYSLNANWQVYGRVDNLFDRNYTALLDTWNNKAYAVVEGLSSYLGVRYQF
jgi:vitamin B12 transporter